MKLFYASASPFARKVRVVLAEKGLEAEIVSLNPWEEPEALTAVNPISQVPTLVTDDGVALSDSKVACAWLDSIGHGAKLIPDGEAQWPVRQLEAAADAISENVVKLRAESMRPEGERSSTHPPRWRRTVVRALDALERSSAQRDVNLGEIALVVALDYIDLRQPDLDWRSGRPNLVTRWEALADRPSLAQTRPA